MTKVTPQPTLNQRVPPARRDELLSPHISRPRSRHFFLNLGGGHPGKSALAFGGREHCNPDYRIDRRTFAYHVLEYVAEGAGWVQFGKGARQLLRPGCVFVCRRQTACQMGVEREQPMVKYFLCLSSDTAVTRLNKAGAPAERVRWLARHGELRNVMEELIREGQGPGSRVAEICAVLFDLLLLKMADAEPLTKHTEVSRENFLRCKALIDGEAEGLATLEDVAAAARLEVSSVCRLFRRYQGISPYQYLLRRKMNLAAEFLVDGRGLVKEAAQSVGFADPFHFSRCFKSVHGVAPSELIRRKGGRDLP
jgi:AraC family transcriptional regulator